MQSGKIHAIHSALGKANSFIHSIAACSTGLFLAILFIQVFMRYVFKSPIYGLDELVIALMVWSMSLGFAVVYWENEHATIELLLKYFPKSGKKAVYFLTNIIVLICSVSLVPGGIKLFILQSRTISLGGLFFSRAYYYALPIIVLGFLLSVMSAFRTLEYAITGDDSIMTSKPAEGGVNVD